MDNGNDGRKFGRETVILVTGDDFGELDRLVADGYSVRGMSAAGLSEEGRPATACYVHLVKAAADQALYS